MKNEIHHELTQFIKLSRISCGDAKKNNPLQTQLSRETNHLLPHKPRIVNKYSGGDFDIFPGMTMLLRLVTALTLGIAACARAQGDDPDRKSVV